MKLYIVQHGEALSKEVDPERALSEQGTRDVDRLSDWLAGAGVRVGRAVHSGKTRARQSAELLASRLCPGVEATLEPGLAPLDPVEPVAERIEELDHDLLIAGHQPFVGKLASVLLAGADDVVTLGFAPATTVCMERDEAGAWSLAWMVRPELLSARS